MAILLSCFTLQAQVKFNGNFEELDNNGNPTGWDLTYYHTNTYDIKVDSLVKMQGKYSVSISSGNDTVNSVGAIIFPIHQRLHGKILTLTGTIKTENVTGGGAGIWLRVDGANKNILGIIDLGNNRITGTTAWREYYVQLPYDEREALTINAGAELQGKGKMWIDSMRLYLDDEPIGKAALSTAPLYLALKDTAFKRSSGIDTIIANEQNIKYLTLLGELWGFLKYHHPATANGDYNWDAQLFRILPIILKCRTDKQASSAMEKWVDGLGKPAFCTNCSQLPQTHRIAVKPDYGSLFNNTIFQSSLIAKLQFILANSNNSTNYYIEIGGDTFINPVFKHEPTYYNIKNLDAGYRLLALYRYWNMIQYFSPNRKLITEDWDKVLPRYIPQLVHANSKLAYIKTMVKLICTTHDTHAFISNDVYTKYLGNYREPFQGKFIEDKLVVTGYYKDTLQVKKNFKIGDVITSINGVSVGRLVEKYKSVSSASNKGGALRDMPGMYLLRSSNPQFRFTLIRNNRSITIKQQAIENSKIDSYNYDYNPDAKAPSYHLINKKIGYIFPGRYHSADMDGIKKQFVNTKGIIVDMRCYPSGDILSDFRYFIKPDISDFASLTCGSVSHPGLFVYTDAHKSVSKTHPYYKGKVVVIVNSTTQSAAEFAVMAFQSAPNVTVIGSQSAGADGNISDIPLPGITTWMSGLGVFYPDGTNAQRAGVKINYIVKPTIRGIKAGRDELLEKAEQLIVGN
jgi:C-terminal processing protease CtpA/Prc